MPPRAMYDGVIVVVTELNTTCSVPLEVTWTQGGTWMRHVRNSGVAGGSQECGCTLCHLAQDLAPGRQVDVSGINECTSFYSLSCKKRVMLKGRSKPKIAAGSNNHLHIICLGCCHFYKETHSLLFFFKYVPLLFCLFHFWKRHGCKKYCPFLFSLLLRETTA